MWGILIGGKGTGGWALRGWSISGSLLLGESSMGGALLVVRATVGMFSGARLSLVEALLFVDVDGGWPGRGEV